MYVRSIAYCARIVITDKQNEYIKYCDPYSACTKVNNNNFVHKLLWKHTLFMHNNWALTRNISGGFPTNAIAVLSFLLLPPLCNRHTYVCIHNFVHTCTCTCTHNNYVTGSEKIQFRIILNMHTSNFTALSILAILMALQSTVAHWQHDDIYANL